MMRIVPTWVCNMHKDLEKAVEDVAYDYGISYSSIKDSKSIAAAIDSLRSTMESIADVQRPDYRPSMWYEDRKFGGKRELANNEDKKLYRNRKRRERWSSKHTTK